MINEVQFKRLTERTRFDGDCLLWTGTVSKRGYGTYLHQRVHKVFWEYLNGEVPEGLELAHACNRKLCLVHVRPKTHAENMEEFSGKTKAEDCSKCGRALEGDNLYVPPSRPSDRRCVWCRKKAQRVRYWISKGLSKEEALARE